jgi:mono/diheme cytochrome c family protein
MTQGMRRLFNVLITGFALTLMIVMAGSARAQEPGGNAAARALKNPVASTPAAVTAGAATYKKYCAFCHGATGKGDGALVPKGMMPADLTDATWVRGETDGEIFAVIMGGAGPKFEMKGYKGKIPDQDVWNMVTFLRTLAPAKAAR